MNSRSISIGITIGNADGLTCLVTRNVFFFAQRHAFHLVDPSIMPLLSSLSCLVTALGAVLYFHGFIAGLNIQLFGLFSILVCMFF